jgi:hypothetical protein
MINLKSRRAIGFFYLWYLYTCAQLTSYLGKSFDHTFPWQEIISAPTYKTAEWFFPKQVNLNLKSSLQQLQFHFLQGSQISASHRTLFAI